MSTGRDDDALSWGEDDPTLDTGGETAAPAKQTPPIFRPAPAPAAAVSAPPAESRSASPAQAAPADEALGLGNVALVALGMIAMAYILFAVGWFIVSLRLGAVEGLPVAGVTVVAIAVVAALAPLVWFAAAFILTRHHRSWVRFAWLVAGLALLVPWPFLATGAFA